jgi:hypothetical protein
MDNASKSGLVRRLGLLASIALVVLFAAMREWAFAIAFAIFCLAEGIEWRQSRARVPAVLAFIIAAYAVIFAHLVLKWI